MHPMLARLLCCIMLCGCSAVLSAQRADSLMKVSHEELRTERVHIHFDKTVYNPGETIWYKAYLFSGNMPSDISTNFYMDWYDGDGKLLQHISAPVIGSAANSHFDIPIGYAGKALEVKAYTLWMLNSDQAFVFDKYIRVAQAASLNTQNTMGTTTVSFFAEGGDLVAGLQSRLAFMATNSMGMPVEVKGVIKNNKGEPVDSFASEHDGMGSLLIEPLADEKFIVAWVDQYGYAGLSQIPSPKKSGIVMQVRPLSSRAMIQIKRTADAADNLKTLHLVAHMNGEAVFTASANMQTATQFNGQIPVLSLPAGILQITLFDAKWIPVTERIVFIKGDDYSFETNVTLPVKNFGRRGKNEMEVSVADSIFSDLSVSVTEASVSGGSDNIFAQLLLGSEIKGYVHNPMYYFSEENDAASAHLDLVMQTHGWRRIRWEEMAKVKKPELPFPRDGFFINLSGTIKNQSSLKVPAAEPLVGLLQNRRDSGQQFFTWLLENNGTFEQPGMSFYDSVKLMYRFPRSARYTEKSEIAFTTNLLGYPPVFKSRVSNPFALYDSASIAKSVIYGEDQTKMYAAIKAHQLPNVTVTKKIKKNVDILDDMYVSARFKDEGFQFDIENDARAQSGINLFQYIEGRIPGLRIVYDTTMTPIPKWRLQKTDVYLDEVYQDPVSAKNIQMRDIAYVKVLRPGTSVGGGGSSSHFGGSPGGLIAAYSKRGVSVKEGDVFKTKYIVGYTPFKDFYSPDYSVPGQEDIPDARTTLYWNPSIKLDAEKRSVRLPFYNNDFSKRIRIVLEGMNAEGKLTRVEKIVE